MEQKQFPEAVTGSAVQIWKPEGGGLPSVKGSIPLTEVLQLVELEVP